MKAPLRIAFCLSAILAFVLFNSCEHDSTPTPTVVKQWSNLVLKANMETPAPVGRNEEGEANVQLLSDNSLKYDFHIHNLSPSDNLTAAHIHVGDAVTAGPVFINLNPSFSGPGASGTVLNLRQGQVDSLLNMPVYINVHSTQAPGGIVRSQMDKYINFAMDIPLLGTNEVPAVTTTCSGMALLRLSGDTLFSMVSFTGMEVGDTMTVSHIHRGAVGVNGPVRIFLANTNVDFGVARKTFLVDSLKNIVLNDPSYVNAHSKSKPGGKIRGPIR